MELNLTYLFNHRNIKDALYDNEVYECFRTTLARAKKVVRGVGTTAETKTAMDEFEQLMERIHSQVILNILFLLFVARVVVCKVLFAVALYSKIFERTKVQCTK